MPIFKNVTPRSERQHEIIIGCDCSSVEHQVKVCYYDEDGHRDEFVSFCPILVTWKNFFRRLWDGLKYAFGYKSRYGHFDEILLYRDDVLELIEFLKGFVNES